MVKRKQHPYGSMNPYGSNYHRRSDDVTSGMVDMTKIVVGGAVMITGLNLVGGMLRR